MRRFWWWKGWLRKFLTTNSNRTSKWSKTTPNTPSKPFSFTTIPSSAINSPTTPPSPPPNTPYPSNFATPPTSPVRFSSFGATINTPSTSNGYIRMRRWTSSSWVSWMRRSLHSRIYIGTMQMRDGSARRWGMWFTWASLRLRYFVSWARAHPPHYRVSSTPAAISPPSSSPTSGCN